MTAAAVLRGFIHRSSGIRMAFRNNAMAGFTRNAIRLWLTRGLIISSRMTIKAVIWTAYIGDIISSLDRNKKSVEAIDQAFAQSPYLKKVL